MFSGCIEESYVDSSSPKDLISITYDLKRKCRYIDPSYKYYMYHN